MTHIYLANFSEAVATPCYQGQNWYILRRTNMNWIYLLTSYKFGVAHLSRKIYLAVTASLNL